MSLKSEGKHAGEFVVSEANGSRSREAVTVTVPANTTYEAGTVLGQLSADGKYVQYDDAETDGREDAAGVLYEEVVNDTGGAVDVDGVIVARDAEVRRADLVYADGTSAQDKLDAEADLAAIGIIAR